MNWIEWVGYAGAGLVVTSFLVSSDIRALRLINMMGAIMFVIYGYLLDINWPLIIPNVVITFIQLYYLLIKKPARV
ncbi:MAG: uroporphyrinogen decarboxylase [Sphingobacteriales bacterium]|nr:uroporphyrinogen decarboxylase [Sphingobacteriales bacterium]